MSTRSHLTLTALSALLALSACDEAADLGDVEFRAEVDNSAALNGIYINGIYINGIYINGIYINGIYINSALLGGATVGGVDFVGGLDPKGNAVTCTRLDETKGKISVISAAGGCDVDPQKGEEAKGDKAIGTMLEFTSPDGDYRLTLDDADEVDHLYRYLISVEFKDDAEGWTGETHPLCYDGLGNPTEALLLPGEWDQTTGERLDDSFTTLTVACRHAALAKCVEWGYLPGDAPTKDHHQACVHMVRADYDATGEAHTENGTTIYVNDAIGVNDEDDVEGLIKEAEWGVDGALCVNRAAFRHSELTGCEDPSDPATCFPGIPECGGDLSDRSLTMPGALLVTAVLGS
ncbi:MAG: ADYC domain-containing protein [Nannocystaceae bacterium]